MFRAWPLVLVALAVPAFAADPIVPFQQSRTTSVFSSLVSLNDPNEPNDLTHMAPDFGDWLDGIWFEGPVWDVPLQSVRRDVAQYSTLTDSAIEVCSVAEVNLEGCNQWFMSHSIVRSACLVRFAVAKTSQFELTGDVNVLATVASSNYPNADWDSLGADASVHVRLRQLAGAVQFEEALGASPVIWTFDPNGIPDPNFPDDPNAPHIYLYPPSIDPNDPHAPFVAQTAKSQTLEFATVLPSGIYELDVSAEVCVNTTYQPYGYPRPRDYWFDNLGAESSFCTQLSVTPVPETPPGNADLDGDNDVDLVDLARMQQTWTGPR